MELHKAMATHTERFTSDTAILSHRIVRTEQQAN
jgi:hypothetical protein